MAWFDAAVERGVGVRQAMPQEALKGGVNESQGRVGRRVQKTSAAGAEGCVGLVVRGIEPEINS